MYKTYSVYLGFVLMCSLVSGCKSQITQQELLNYLNDLDNGLKQEVSEGSIKMSITYRPTDLIIGQSNVQEAYSREREKGEYSKYSYFILSMSIDDKDILYKNSRSQTHFSEVLNRLNFAVTEYIYGIADGKDTINLADFYVPNLYGMGGSTQIMLAFPNTKTCENFELRIKEMGLGIGERRFLFRHKDIEDIPKLITSF
jgi:hypothetical protein